VLGIQKPEDVCYSEVELEYPINYNEENNITFKYAPCGFYRPLYKNINCEGTDDKMQYKFYYTYNPDIYIKGLQLGLIMTGMMFFILKVVLIIQIQQRRVPGVFLLVIIQWSGE